VHEGTVRFEHCNRLDLDQNVNKTDCRKCWSTWLDDYTYGQPRDRIDYARRRAKSLANGDERPTLRFDERGSEQRQFYLVVPGPTSIHAPPPPVATVWKDGTGGAGGTLAKNVDATPPAENCADECRTTWKACGAECTNGNGAGHADDHGHVHGPRKASNGARKAGGDAGTGKNGNGCSAKCGSDYSSCMKRCFE
jgi:hypothetical protein